MVNAFFIPPVLYVAIPDFFDDNGFFGSYSSNLSFFDAFSRSLLFLDDITLPFKDDTGILSLDAFLNNFTVFLFS
jgi:hypothetical protein